MWVCADNCKCAITSGPKRSFVCFIANFFPTFISFNGLVSSRLFLFTLLSVINYYLYLFEPDL